MTTQALQVKPIDRRELAKLAPHYDSMRSAIERCTKVDELAKLANQAVAVQAYFRVSQDVENEIGASRIRVRAERKLGELLRRMAANGERTKAGDNQHRSSRRATTSLASLGIPRDRAARAMELFDVPENEFEAALAEPRTAQPRRILDERKGKAAITKTLNLWGRVRDLGDAISSGEVPPLEEWRTNLQPFQLAQLRRSIPVILEYLTRINKELQ